MTDTTIAVGCASDFALAAIPWFYISKLKIKRREKAAIGVAMSVGCLYVSYPCPSSLTTRCRLSRINLQIQSRDFFYPQNHLHHAPNLTS